MSNLNFYKLANLFSCLLILIAVNGCASLQSGEPPKERTRLEIDIFAEPNVNPDETRRPSPIQIIIYELKSPAIFSQSDYFSLYNGDKTILGADMLSREEYIIRPNERKLIKRKSKEGTVAIGILAGYYNLAKSNWRIVSKLPNPPDEAWYRLVLPSNKFRLKVALEEQGINIVENE